MVYPNFDKYTRGLDSVQKKVGQYIFAPKNVDTNHEVRRYCEVYIFFHDFCFLVVDVNSRLFYTKKFRVMTSSVSECDTKNTDLSKLGSYQISDKAQYNIVR